MTPSPNKQPIPNPFGYQPAQGNEQYGPFTNALAPDQPQRQNVQPSGYGGAKEALAMFASKFLEGAQAGRRQKFEESERTKMEHAKNFDSVYEHIANNPAYTKEAKDAAFQAWSQQRFGDIQKQMSEGEKGSKGKGKSGGNAKPENPLMHIARSVVGHVLGPGENKEHKDFGPESVHDLLRIANDPKSQINLPDMTEKATSAMKTAIQGAKDAATTAGVTLDRGTLLSMPSVQSALNPFTQNNIDWQKIPQLSALVEGVQPAMTDIEKAQLKREEQLTATGKSQEALTEQQRTAHVPVVEMRTGDKGPEVVGMLSQDPNGNFFKDGKPYTPPEGHWTSKESPSIFSSQMQAKGVEERLASQKEIEEMRITGRQVLTQYTQAKIDKRSEKGQRLAGSEAIVKHYQDLLDKQAANAKARSGNQPERDRIAGESIRLTQELAEKKDAYKQALTHLQTGLATPVPPGKDTPKDTKPDAPPDPAMDAMMQELLGQKQAPAAPPK